MPFRNKLCARLSAPLSELLMTLSVEDAQRLEEIRVRLRCRTEFVFDRERRIMPYAPDESGMKDLIAALSGYALYAYERQMAEGFIPLPEGHRAGVCGRFSFDEKLGVRLCGVMSVCIRIARQADGASVPIRRFLCDAEGRPRSVLLLGVPGCGKTTALRDAAIYLSRDMRLHVAAADEREELFPDGAASDTEIDVLLGLPKALALGRLLRSMAPQVMVMDEIGRTEDAAAAEEAVRCGVALLATAHAASLEEAMARPTLRSLIQSGVFDRFILLGRHGVCLDVWDREARRRGVEDGNGYGSDGFDWRERHRLSGGGWREGPRALYPRDAPQPAQDA